MLSWRVAMPLFVLKSAIVIKQQGSLMQEPAIKTMSSVLSDVWLVDRSVEQARLKGVD
jgi:hypothetical protein